LNAVTYINTRGDTESPRFNPDKAELSSEFGTAMKRKQSAFELAGTDASWQSLVATGDQIMQALLVRPVTVTPLPFTPSTGAGELARLLAK